MSTSQNQAPAPPPPQPQTNGGIAVVMSKPIGSIATLKTLLDKNEQTISAVLPRQVKPQHLIKMCLLAVSRQPLLLKCLADSIYKSILTAAELGLVVGGAIPEAHLVPFWNTKREAYECQLIPDYRGLIKLARNSDDLKFIEARLVREGDDFDFCFTEAGLKLTHKPKAPSTAPTLGAYALAHSRSEGGPQFDYMDVAELTRIKERSKARNKAGDLVGPWVTDEGEMQRKTVVKRLCKYLPMSVELATAIDLDNREYIDIAAESLSAETEEAGSRAEKLAKDLAAKRAPQTTEPQPVGQEPPPTNGQSTDGQAGRTPTDEQRNTAESAENTGASEQPNEYDQQRATITDFVSAFEELNLKGKVGDFIELEAGRGIRTVGKIPDDKLPNVRARLEAEYAKVKGGKKK
jgi:recombination protein RecT